MKTISILLFTAAATCLAFGVWTSAQTDSPASGGILVVPPGAGPKTNRTEWKLLGGQSDGQLSVGEVNVPAEGVNTGPGPHMHTREDEAWYVISGELTFEIGDKITTAGPGTFVWAPRNIPHRFLVTKAPAKFLLILSPAGLEAFFAKRAELLERLRPGTPEFEAEQKELARQYGAQMLDSVQE